MADELSKIDLSKLTVDQVKQMKNEAMERLKSAGHLGLYQSHQDGVHSSHTNHSTE